MSQTRAVIYLRQSLDQAGDQLAIKRQREDCQRIARDRGWTVVAEYVDNSISASDKRKDRPAYNAMVEAFGRGEFGALVCYDLDRLTRQPRQLEDWIDRAEESALTIVTANGEADLGTDAGRLFARIKASVARAETDRKSARQRRAALQRAEDGRPPLGTRLTGYTSRGELVPAEADVVREVFSRFLRGESLRAIAAWLDEAAVPTRRGGRWHPSSVRGILSNPRYAGLAVYDGRPNGQAGTWEPLVPSWEFDVVQAKLADPRRRKQVGTDRKHLGSGLHLCGVCGKAVRSHTSTQGTTSQLRYRCPDGHVVRSAAKVDEYVLAVLRARLGRGDLGAVLAVPESIQARRATGEVERQRARLVQVEADYDGDLIDAQRYKVKREKVVAELAAAEAAQIRLLAPAAVAGTLRADDPVAAFNEAPLGAQRAVLEFFLTVRLLRAPRGRHFDSRTVAIDWLRDAI